MFLLSFMKKNGEKKLKILLSFLLIFRFFLTKTQFFLKDSNLFFTMVSQDSPSNSNSSNLHQFIISNSIANNQNQFRTHNFNPTYGTDSVSNTHYSLLDLLGTSNEAAAQRLSLSLGSNQTPLNFNSAYLSTYSFTGNGFNQSCSYGTESLSEIIGSSKYLKPAQSLLEEIVTVGCKEIDLSNEKYVEKLSRGRKGYFGLSNEIKAGLSNTEMLIENHEACINLLKLLAMLEEVERRYEEYYQHMEELITSFEVTTGLGAGKSYTSLALQAMSKHFSNLRNAILSQIRIAKQKMAKDMPKISSRLSQLSMIDQNRIPLQQLGIMQNSRQAWRPIRGLPETSVAILRAWLFEHFLNPYPNDSEKVMLASHTCLSKTQVSNWFINARVRLWKPMIEEMYKDELAAESYVESDPLVTMEGVGDSADDLN